MTLRPVHVRSVCGLLFVCLSDTPHSDFEDFAETLSPCLAPHDLAHAKVAAQIDWIEDRNWTQVDAFCTWYTNRLAENARR